MSLSYNKKLIPAAKELRNNATRQENHLWYDFLRTYPIRFQRQKTIDEFVVDFYCHKAGLVIELDGSQHYDEDGEKKDKERTEFLMRYGIRVIRIPNNEVNCNFRGVCEYIDNTVKEIFGQFE